MKNLYDPDKRHWDRYNTFASGHMTAKPHYNSWNRGSGFQFFETGEIVFDGAPRDIDIRRLYSDIGVDIVSTNNPGYKFIHPKTGEKIPAAQLSHNGQQILLIDLESKRAVRLDGRDTNKNLPTHLASADAYALSSEAPIMGNNNIIVNAPSPITDEAREWKSVIEVIIKLDKANNPDAYNHWYNTYHHYNKVSLSNVQKTPYEFLKSMDVSQKTAIANLGVTFDRTAIPEPYLLIN